jgi:tRNA threonylcarbamoyladenosine biosynthesis protein TsaB
MSSIYLYIDTTKGLIVALLDNNFEVKNLVDDETSKSASIIHEKMYSLLEREGVTVEDLDGVIINNGPGSYTGVRVGEGIAKIFELDGIKIVSFLEHEAISSITASGYWVANAFKGESFIYSWKEGEGKREELISSDDLTQKISGSIFSNDELDINNEVVSSKKFLIKNISKVAHFYFKKGERKKPFYFRDLEDEFKVKK